MVGVLYRAVILPTGITNEFRARIWCIFVRHEYVKSAGMAELDLYGRARAVWIPMAVLEVRSQVFFKQHSVSSARKEARTHMSAGSHDYFSLSPPCPTTSCPGTCGKLAAPNL